MLAICVEHQLIGGGHIGSMMNSVVRSQGRSSGVRGIGGRTIDERPLLEVTGRSVT